ncbi:hypothetical protein [Yersinia thracica]|uniref:hypothetical protein n=1 Tax=Yersinia thracica TaxID=2890319 RepID=UPI00119EA7FA|nr:hypothetical protein [Yersinia thracica]
MKIIPATFTSVIGFMIICFNANAINSIPTVLNQKTNLIELSHSSRNSDDSSSPTFEVYNLKDNYPLVEDKAKITFSISSNEFISYYAYVIKNNLYYGDASGYVNNSSVHVDIFTKYLTSGNYELVIEAYNNDQKSSQQTFDIRLGQ